MQEFPWQSLEPRIFEQKQVHKKNFGKSLNNLMSYFGLIRGRINYSARLEPVNPGGHEHLKSFSIPIQLP